MCRSFCPQQPQHLDLLHEIVGTLKNVGVAVNPLTREVARDGHHITVLVLVSQLVGLGDRIDVGCDRGVIDDALDLLTVDKARICNSRRLWTYCSGCLDDMISPSYTATGMVQLSTDPRVKWRSLPL